VRYIAGVCLIFCLSLSPGHMPYSGQIGVVARWDGTRCTWSGTSRTYMNGTAHAAESCAASCRAAPAPLDFAHGMPLPKVFRATPEPFCSASRCPVRALSTALPSHGYPTTSRTGAFCGV